MIDGKAAVMIAGSLSGALCFWSVVYGWGKWLNRPRQNTSLPDTFAQDERLRRIEAAIETMSVEVERIGEGQRFANKLLAERRPASTTPNPSDSTSRPYRPAVTPH
jgi:hypothetical protein